MKMPSSVSAMISASVPSRGSIEMFVMRISGRWLQPSARLVALDAWPTTGAVSRDVRKFSNMPSTMIGVACAGTPSSSKPNVPRPPGRVASAVIETRSLAYRTLPAVVGRQPGRAGVGLFHAEHAVQLDGVTDRLVDLQLHLAAVEHQGRDLAGALRRASAGRRLRAPRVRLPRSGRGCGCARSRPPSRDHGTNWGSCAAARRRPRRPSPRCRRPECSTTCSIAAPSEEANHVERRKKSMPASANVTPGTDCIRRVASMSSGNLLLERHGERVLDASAPRHVAIAGSTGDRVTGSPGSRCAARAISTASAAVRSISAGSSREVAANPHRPPTSTRMPTPVEVSRSMPAISWLRTVMDSVSSMPARASAKSAPALRAASTAIFATSSTAYLSSSDRPARRRSRRLRGMVPGAPERDPGSQDGPIRPAGAMMLGASRHEETNVAWPSNELSTTRPSSWAGTP